MSRWAESKRAAMVLKKIMERTKLKVERDALALAISLLEARALDAGDNR